MIFSGKFIDIIGEWSWEYRLKEAGDALMSLGCRKLVSESSSILYPIPS
jgi:hypothetical protein